MRNHAQFWAAFIFLVTVSCGKGDAGTAPSDQPAGELGKGGATGSGGSGGKPSGSASGGNAGASAGAGGNAGGKGGNAGSAGGTGGKTGADAGGAQDSGSGPTAPRSDASTSVVSDAASAMAGPPGPWARDIAIGLVEVSQGVFVKLGEGTTVLAAAERNAPLIEGRPLMVRVFVAPGTGFTARRLRGVVTVSSPSGGAKQYEEAKMITGRSDPERVDTTFNVLLPADAMKGETSLWVALYEADGAPGAEPAAPPRFPAMGATDLAVKTGKLELDVVVVPVTGPGGPLADTPERRKALADQIYDLYPVQKVNMRVREPHVITAKMTSSSAGFTVLRNLRMMDNAKPNEYYHLIVTRADTTFSFTGVASGAGAGVGDGNRRVAITATGTRVLDGNSNTMAHEIAHNMGRNHAPGCGASGADMMYPYPMSNLNVNGFSFSEMALKSKTRFKELLGYCRPRWISDYTWKALETRVRIVSAFPTAQPGTMALTERSLQAYVGAGPGETPDWGIVPGLLVDQSVPVSPQRQARLVLDDGSTLVMPVSVALLTDDLTREIAVNLPAGATVVRAEVVVDGEHLPIDVAALPSP